MKNKYEIRGDVTVIFINRQDGNIIEALIDTNDLDMANEFKNTWISRYNKITGMFYVWGKLKGKVIHLHRFIIKPVPENVIDHINHNPLDNRRCNLREVTQPQNSQNRNQDNRGISYCPKYQKWRVRVASFGKRISIGSFDSLEQAKMAAEEARSKLMPFSKEALNGEIDHGLVRFNNKQHKNKSGYSNVYPDGNGKWVARLKYQNKGIYLGKFDEPYLAHLAVMKYKETN